MPRPLRIAQVAPPLEPVPPPAYGGTERIVAALVEELDRRGHEVTTFAPGDSDVPGRLVPTVPTALWQADDPGDVPPWFMATIHAVLERADQFDLIHSHLEWYSPLLAQAAPVPVVTTFHGRLDLPWARPLLHRSPGRLVAISRAQAATQPDAPWAGIIHNGLPLADAPFGERPGDDLAFVGRLAPEKGIVEAIDIALRSGRRLRIAAKAGKLTSEREYYDAVVRPALHRAGNAVEFLGEVTRAERDLLFAGSAATLMPGAWPEPFGLVAIESMACGTPIVARPVGALPEIIRDRVDGLFASGVNGLVAALDRVAGLDRVETRRSVIDRFSAERMVDAYEALFARVASGLDGAPGGEGREGGDGSAAGARRTPLAVGPGHALPLRPPMLVSAAADRSPDREPEPQGPSTDAPGATSGGRATD